MSWHGGDDGEDDRDRVRDDDVDDGDDGYDCGDDGRVDDVDRNDDDESDDDDGDDDARGSVEFLIPFIMWCRCEWDDRLRSWWRWPGSSSAVDDDDDDDGVDDVMIRTVFDGDDRFALIILCWRWW
jgi:hypothetical protein